MMVLYRIYDKKCLATGKSWNYFLHKLKYACITTPRVFAVRDLVQDQERHFMVYLLYLFYLIEYC